MPTLAATLAACSGMREVSENYRKDVQTTKDSYDMASIKKASNFSVMENNWVNPNPIPKKEMSEHLAPLPSVFSKRVQFTMPGQVSLIEVFSEIQRTNKVKVEITQDIHDSSAALPSVIKGDGGNSSEVEEKPIYVSDFVYTGTLRDALDYLASLANISWRWDGEKVQFFRYEIRTYSINLLAGKTEASSEVNLASETSDSSSGGEVDPSSGKTSASNKQGVTRTSTLDSWAEVRNHLMSLMTPRGKLVIMESTGLVTVKDTPDAQRRVSQAVKELNDTLGAQIFVNVDIYSVERSSSDNYGLDWNLVWSNSADFGGAFTSNTPTISDSSAVNVRVLSGPFKDSKLMLNALSKIGKASVVNQFRIATLNGQPTPIGSNRKQQYIAGYDTQTSGETVVRTPKVSSVNDGVSMNIIPRVQPNGKILLEYSMNLASIGEFKQFGEGADALNLPETTLKNIIQRASLRSGETLVLSGFKQSKNQLGESGIGEASNFLFGGSRTSQGGESYLVITVTPYLAKD